MSKFNLHLIDQFIDSIDVLLGDKIDARTVQLNAILDAVFGPDAGGWPSQEDMHRAGFHMYPVATDVVWAQNQLMEAIEKAYPHLAPKAEYFATIMEEEPARSGRLGEIDARLAELHECGAEMSRERSCYETEAEWMEAFTPLADEIRDLTEEMNRLDNEDIEAARIDALRMNVSCRACNRLGPDGPCRTCVDESEAASVAQADAAYDAHCQNL